MVHVKYITCITHMWDINVKATNKQIRQTKTYK